MQDRLRVIIADIRAGDREALSRFVHDYGDLIRMLAWRTIVRRRMEFDTEVDDILGATILELCRGANRIRASEPGEFMSYVRRIVQSQVHSLWRNGRTSKRHGSRRCRRACSDFDVADPRGSTTTDVELRELLSCAYDQLSGQERLIAMLRRSGWSWIEIAERLGTTKGAVRKRWERAVARVLRLLA